MKAPDKIHISTTNEGDNHYYIDSLPDNDVDKKNEIDYIRKDFLLEWLDKMKEDLIKDSDFRDTEVGRYDAIATIRYRLEKL